MDITIQEHKFSFRSEYDILTPDTAYSATKSLFSFNDRLQLKTEDGRVLARIKGHFSPLRSRYDFVLTDGRFYRYRCEKLWKRVFICEGNGSCFHLYEHKGLNYSVFHNDRQVAAFVKNHIVIGKGNQYSIRLDADADMIIVLCLALAVNSSEDDDNGSSVTFDFGNIGPEDRPFDKTWEPR